MSISDNYSPDKSLGNGVTTVFTGAWKVLDASYFRLTFEDVTTGIQTLKTLGSDYSLTFNESGYVATMFVAPTSQNYVIRSREIEKNQTDPYKTSKGFQGEVIEDSLDKLTAITQDQQDAIDRSAKFPLGSSLVGILPTPVDDCLVAWDGVDGKLKNGVTNSSISNVLSTATDAATTATNAANTATAAATQAVSAAGSVTYLWAGTAGGTANAFTLTPSPALSSYVAGAKLRFRPVATNTSGTVTVNVSGLGVKTVKKTIGGLLVALAVNDLQINTIVEIEYDGTDFQVINVLPHSKGADIASAATLNLNTATGDYVHVTGTTGITAITLSEGREMTLRFAGALTITNGASLITGTGANITTTSTTVLKVRGEASGVVRVVTSNIAPAVPSQFYTLIKSVTAASDSSISFINGVAGVVLNSTYKEYMIKFKNLVPTADASFWIETTSNAGSTWATTTGDYAYANVVTQSVSGSTSVTNVNSNSDSQLRFGSNVNNSGGLNGQIILVDPADATRNKQFYGFGGHEGDTTVVAPFNFSGIRLSTADIDGFRVQASGTTIATGIIELWGIANA